MVDIDLSWQQVAMLTGGASAQTSAAVTAAFITERALIRALFAL